VEKDGDKRICHERGRSETYEPKLVSAIIPTYNRAGFIIATLDSVFGQTYRPIEVIIIDDGSTDNTREAVGKWHRKCTEDTKFRLHYLFQKNKGAAAARNSGLIESHGEFIQFVDSDDLLAPSKISEQVRVLSSCEAKTAAYGRWRFFENSQNDIQVYDTHSIMDEDNALKEWIRFTNFVPLHSLLWRRDDIRHLGQWDETLAADQDGEFSMRFLLNGGRMVLCPSAWVYYCNYKGSSDSIRRSKNRKTFESRLRVTARVESQLSAKGLLNEYQEALSFRYAALAKKSALYYKDLTNFCLENSKRLSPTGKLPDIFPYPLLSRLLGLTLKQRIGYFGHTVLGIPRRKRSAQFKPTATVKSTAKLCSFDEPETKD